MTSTLLWAVLKRLTAITLLTVLAVFLALSLLRHLGSLQGPQTYDHPLLSNTETPDATYTLWALYPHHAVQVPEKQVKITTPRGHKLDLTFIPMVEVYPTLNENFEVRCSTPCPPTPLSELLARFHHQPLLIFFRSPERASVRPFYELYGDQLTSNQVLVLAENKNVLRELRKLRPDWLFGSDPISHMILKLLTGIWIETTADLWHDFYVLTLELSRAEDPGITFSLSTRLRTELKRRSKAVVLDLRAAASLEEAPNVAKHLIAPLRGVMTNRPSEAIQFLIQFHDAISL